MQHWRSTQQKRKYFSLSVQHRTESDRIGETRDRTRGAGRQTDNFTFIIVQLFPHLVLSLRNLVLFFYSLSLPSSDIYTSKYVCKTSVALPLSSPRKQNNNIRDETEQTGNSTLVYGEITFKTLALALHKIKTKYGLPGVGSSGPDGVLQGAGGTFYDIGSGTGKPVSL